MTQKVRSGDVKAVTLDVDKKLVKLYHAVNELMCKLGADGEVNAHQDEACTVMSALADIDGGAYDDKFDGKQKSSTNNF